jgi:H+/Cl- antiporter ClcA
MAILRERRYLMLLVLAVIAGVIVSFAAWGFLELTHQLQTWLYTDLPRDVGYDGGPPLWWSLPLLLIAGVIVAFAIDRLPGSGGHVPSNGLSAGMTQPIALPGVMLAAIATLGAGVVLGPEAPLIALGGGLGILCARLVRRDAPEQMLLVMGVAGTFAALSMIFSSPLIAAVVLIEAAGLGGPRLPVVLLPGLLAAGIGSLVSIGMGSWTGLSTSDYALGALSLPHYERPTFAALCWTVALALVIAGGVAVIFPAARAVQRLAKPRPFLVLPAVGLLVGGLAIAYSQAADKSFQDVLFSGQELIGPLTASPGAWSLGALALLLAFKAIAWSLSLGSFRGGPIFPALLLGAAAGMMAGQLPGFDLTPAVAVGMGAGVSAALRLPLAAVVLALLLTSGTGPGASPLVIVGVVVAYLAITGLSSPRRA